MRDSITQPRYSKKIQAVQFIQDADRDIIRHPDIKGVKLEAAGQSEVCGGFADHEPKHVAKGVIEGVVDIVLCADNMSAATRWEVIYDG